MKERKVDLNFRGRFINVFTNFLNLVNKGQERSVKAKKNIIASFFIRGISIAISILIVPITINYIDVSQYGIWLTVSSIVMWFGFFDVGLTQGLRNKFAAAVAKGDDDLAQSYVSTTYGILGIICASLWIIFISVNSFLDWSSILNIPVTVESDVSFLVLIVFTYFCLQFVLRIIGTIITANQQPAIESLIGVIGQVISLIFVLTLIYTTKGSLIKLGIALCLAPLIVYVAAGIYFYNGKYKKYRPRFSQINFSHAKELFSLGIIFFVISIAGMIQYQTANIIIARNFTTTDVTSYNIVYKYFNVLYMAFSIFLTPFWSASTEAFVKKDIGWIKKGMKKYNQLNLLLLGVGLVMLYAANNVYDLWLGKGTVSIGFQLSLWGLLYFSMAIYVDKYVAFLNSINALRLQFISCLISPFIFLGTAFLLIKHFHVGPHALFIASIACNFNGVILAPIQYHMIINKNKRGIWIK